MMMPLSTGGKNGRCSMFRYRPSETAFLSTVPWQSLLAKKDVAHFPEQKS